MTREQKLFLLGLVLIFVGNGLVALGIVMRAKGH